MTRRARAPETSGRSKLVADALWQATGQQSRGSQRTRDGRRMVITSVPTIIYDDAGVELGIECHVRLYDAASGNEIPVDPVRRFLNPPTIVVDDADPGRPDAARARRADPLGAIWVALWDSIDAAPNPDGWVAP